MVLLNNEFGFMFRFFLVVGYTLLNFISLSQTVNNVKVNVFQRTIEVTYDLKSDSFSTVELFCSSDSGTTWKGPMKIVSGDVGDNQWSGTGKKIIWDAAAEFGSIEGYLQFKVVANLNQSKPISMNDTILKKQFVGFEKPKFDSQLNSLRKKRNIWLVSALINVGLGGISYYRTQSLYKNYKTATTNASDIRLQVQRLATVYPIAFAVAGFSVFEFIVQHRKYSKDKNKKILISPILGSRESGITLAMNF